MAEQITKDAKRGAAPAAQAPMRVPLAAKERAEKGPDGNGDSMSLPAAAIRGKLDNLREHLPGKSDAVYEFGAALSKRLGDCNVSPHDFITAADRLILELVEAGGDEEEGRFVDAFARCSPHLLRGILPAITSEVTGPEFAQRIVSVRHDMEEIEREFDLDME